jgi:type III pantothenate kinase
LGEVKSIAEEYKKMFPSLKIIITGGDYKYFVDNLNFSTFAEPNLVLIGLHEILQYNQY